MSIIFFIIIMLVWTCVLESIEPTPINIILNTIISFVNVFAFSWYIMSFGFLQDAFKWWRTDFVSDHKKKGDYEYNGILHTFKQELKERHRNGETIPPDIEQNLFSADPEQFFRNAEYFGYTIQLKRKKMKNPDQES